jgi:hypothetical protein
MDKRRAEAGQGLVELAIILPVLLILLFGLVEMGYALRDYLVVVNACREGCRFAARGRFTQEDVVDRVVNSGSRIQLGAYDYPFLRTEPIETEVEGTLLDPNTAIIVTNVPTDVAGEPLTVTVESEGVLPDEAGGVRAVSGADTKISVEEIVERHRDVTQEVNDAREAAGYERMGNHVVTVEVYYMHRPLWNNPFVPLPDPWMMYAQAEMRVVTDRESVE